ncbi:hypothetical protein EON67_09495 [archaeon]|nr:MAG: hypothetical protein EON67_09495 [archaeon]
MYVCSRHHSTSFPAHPSSCLRHARVHALSPSPPPAPRAILQNPVHTRSAAALAVRVRTPSVRCVCVSDGDHAR